MKKVKVEKQIKRTGIAAFGVLLIAGTVVTICSATKRTTQYQEQELLNYTCESSAEYEVHLIPNDYVEESVCGMDESYIYNLVDKVYVSMGAEYTGSQRADISGNYKVAIVMRGYEYQDGEKTILWEKQLESVENEQLDESIEEWELNKLVPISIRDYAPQGQMAQEELGITCSCEIAVVLSGELDVGVDGQRAQIPLNQSVSIPITDGIFAIERSEGASVEEHLSVQEELPPVMDKKKVAAGAAWMVCALILLILWMVFTENYTSDESKRRKLEAVVRRYKNRVVELEHFPEEQYAQIYKVPNLTELWKAADELRRPVFLIRHETEDQFRLSFVVTELCCQYRYEER